MKGVLKVRRFTKGVDEPVWVELMNAEYQDYVSWWRGASAEEMLALERQSGFDSEGRFIAEVDGKPVGLIYARVEKSGEDKLGVIRDFCVLPAFRSGFVEARLLDAAVNEFQRRGVSHIRAWTGVDRADRIESLEKRGFKFSHRTIDMRISLADVAVNLHENLDVAIRQLRSDMNRDVEVLNWVDNECFKADPLHVSHTVEDTRKELLEDPVLGWREVLFAVLDGKDVGYVGVGIDERYNVEHDVKTGYIKGIGVLPEYRRRGIGTRLLLHGLKRLKDKGMTSASLDTDDTNPTRAKTLYEKVGFRVLQEYVTYVKDVARARS